MVSVRTGIESYKRLLAHPSHHEQGCLVRAAFIVSVSIRFPS